MSFVFVCVRFVVFFSHFLCALKLTITYKPEYTCVTPHPNTHTHKQKYTLCTNTLTHAHTRTHTNIQYVQTH